MFSYLSLDDLNNYPPVKVGAKMVKNPDLPSLRSNPHHVLIHAHFQEQLVLQYLQSTVYRLRHPDRRSSHHHGHSVLDLDLGQLSLAEILLVKRSHALSRTGLATTFLLGMGLL